MNPRCAFSLVLFFSVTACAFHEESGTPATTREKIEASKGLYAENHEQYWNLLHHSYERAFLCASPSEMADFLSLASLMPKPAEVDEFITEGVETLCLQKTACFKEAVKILALDERKAVEQILTRYPLFHEEEELRVCR